MVEITWKNDINTKRSTVVQSNYCFAEDEHVKGEVSRGLTVSPVWIGRTRHLGFGSASATTKELNNISVCLLMMVSDFDRLFADLYEVIPELLQGMNRPGLPSGTPFTGSYCHGQKITQPLPYDRPYPNQLSMQWKANYLNQENVDNAKSITDALSHGYFQNGRIDQGTLWKQTQHISSESKVTKFCMCSCTSGIPQCTCDVKHSVSSELSSLHFLSEPACIPRTQSESNNLHQSGPSSFEYPYFPEYPENTRCQQQSAPRGTSNSIPSHPANVPVKPASFPTYDQIQNNSASPRYDSSQFNINTPEFNQFPKVEYSLPRPRQSSAMNPPKPRPRRKRPRLCHFLLELLANPQQYSNIVEWVDQENGVFKFLNSSEVASQWGRRRDKPNMKYENFARSLRTYIAKGIMTKPRSKLVYKFTNKVL